MSPIESQSEREFIPENTGCQSAPIQMESIQNIARPIHIYPKNKGYLIEVGCQTICFSTLDELLPLLEEYLNFPKETEQKYLAGDLI